MKKQSYIHIRKSVRLSKFTQSFFVVVPIRCMKKICFYSPRIGTEHCTLCNLTDGNTGIKSNAQKLQQWFRIHLAAKCVANVIFLNATFCFSISVPESMRLLSDHLLVEFILCRCPKLTSTISPCCHFFSIFISQS